MKSLTSEKVLRETRERLRSVKETDAGLWGTMSARQMMRHVGDAYEVALGRRKNSSTEARGAISPAMVKLIALRTGVKWPKGVKTTPELVVALNAEEGEAFEDLIDRAIERMEALAAAETCDGGHPIFGTMTRGDWMRWGYLHADHHLRQFGR
jgi:hypothetical protein